MLPTLTWKTYISIAVCAIKNNLRWNATSSTRKNNHYHFLFCNITADQSSNILSYIAKRDYKNENITPKEGELRTKSLFTAKDINEEKCNLNLSPFPTSKKRLLNLRWVKTWLVINTELNLEIYWEYISRHNITGKSAAVCVLLCVCVCVFTLVTKRQSSWCLKVISMKAIQIMCERIESATDFFLSCTIGFSINYMSVCPKNGMRNELHHDLWQVIVTNTSSPESVNRLNKVLDSLGTNDECHSIKV